jgi:hypothetical protein
VVDMDLEKYFDTVNQSKLIEVLSRTIKDGRVISLIHKYLRAGVIIKHSFEETEIGVPQGGPLSPILSNIMLNELDKELERRGHRFVRYADELLIFCRSRRSAQRTLSNILPFIEKKLFLKVNREKTVVDYVGKAIGEFPIAQSYPNPLETMLLKGLGSYSFQIIIGKLQRKLRNRRVPNGMHGGVGGRLLKIMGSFLPDRNGTGEASPCPSLLLVKCFIQPRCCRFLSCP